ncbi:hypothetical protein [Chitinophaga arvensicola]|uniref:DUF1440 domain-containing protein n=1 Tax=Chitinophaga arvensicola TaxID=29529 RepID=A0A1I0S949_9BACT|nr:hypothetical protein [Chitinophaga arvensicola]SEW52540.1 hypothetical protein SAMN04488122_4917 [Chitinophaga arvensicola]
MRIPSSFPGAVLLAGFITGTLDILSAFVHFYIATHGQPVTKILVFVSSGVFGKAAFSAGPSMMWWGLLFHYIIALIWALVFFSIYPKIKTLHKHPIATGIIYGLLVWCIMNLVVLPLSNIPHGPLRLVNSVINILILMAMIGLPLSFMARKYYARG